jgi:hypothetical protein
MTACDVLVTSLLSPPEDGYYHYVGTRIYGLVTDSSGAPIAGMTVTIETRNHSACTSLWSATTAVTDSAGRYVQLLGTSGTPHDVCVRIRANPAPGASVRVDSASVSPVRFSVSQGSTRIDLPLPPSA